MPMKVNVGLTKKLGEANYGSRGASVHVELELDSALVSEPQKLQERIRQVFGLVRSSLADELNGNGHHADANNGAPNNGAKSGSPPRLATQSQQKAIFAICKAHDFDVKPFLRRFNVSKPEQLTVKQASEVIDLLKQEGGSA